MKLLLDCEFMASASNSDSQIVTFGRTMRSGTIRCQQD